MNSSYLYEDGFCNFEEMLASKAREIKSKLFGILGSFRRQVIRRRREVLNALKPVLDGVDRLERAEALDYVAQHGISLPKGRTLHVDYADDKGKRYRIHIS